MIQQEKQMTIELRFQSVSIQPADLQESHPHAIPALQQYLPANNAPKRRGAKKKRKIADLIDTLIENINSD